MHRRCLSSRVVCTDRFCSLPSAAQAMYLQYVMAADDDGMVDSHRRITRQYSRGTQMMDILCQMGYIFHIDDICVITHWRISNTIRSDRQKALAYPATAKKIWIDDDKTYTLKQPKNGQTLYDLRMGKDWDTQKTYEQLLASYPPERTGDLTQAWQAYQDAIRSKADATSAMDHLAQWLVSQSWQQHAPTLASWLSSGDWRSAPAAAPV